MNPTHPIQHPRPHVLIAIACAMPFVIAGMFWSGPDVATRLGAQAGSAGVPYGNMPAIAPIGVKVDTYLDVPTPRKDQRSIRPGASGRSSSVTVST